jgi:hypothetical protein
MTGATAGRFFSPLDEDEAELDEDEGPRDGDEAAAGEAPPRDTARAATTTGAMVFRKRAGLMGKVPP